MPEAVVCRCQNLACSGLVQCGQSDEEEGERKDVVLKDKQRQ